MSSKFWDEHAKNIKKFNKIKDDEIQDIINEPNCKKVYETYALMLNNLKPEDVVDYHEFSKNKSLYGYGQIDYVEKNTNIKTKMQFENFDFHKCILNHPGIEKVEKDLYLIGKKLDISSNHLTFETLKIVDNKEYVISIVWR